MNKIKAFINTYHSPSVYGLSLLLPIIPFLTVFFAPQTVQYINPMLLFIPGIILSAWYGGFRAGVITTVLSTFALIYIALSPIEHFSFGDIISLVNTLFFLGEGVLLCAAIEYYKHTEKDRVYRRKEKAYLASIEQLEKEKIKTTQDLKARDEFLSIASHELRTPLTSMLLQLQTALYNVRNVSLAKFSVQNLLSMLESTEYQSKQLAKMINDLLNISLITTGRLNLELEEADLVTITKEVMSRFSEKLEQDGQQITIESDEKVMTVCDKLRIEQVLTNLISNAIKYGQGNPIHIRIFHNGHAIIRIQDRGIGIPRDKQKIVFSRFKRAVTSSQFTGLGVGLYITNQIVHAHEGTIDVESRPGKGTIFTVKLPVKGPKKQNEKRRTPKKQ